MRASSTAGASDSIDARWPARWQDAWRALGVAAPPGAALEELLARYAEPARAYHTVRHLSECFARLEWATAQTEPHGEVALALFYHDAIYDPRRSDNEARSADLAVKVLRAQGIAPERIDRIQALIMATRHDATPPTPDAALLVDIDLGILAAPTERFDEYEREVRQEYAFVPGMIFRFKRRTILRGFLERARIFSSGVFDDDEEPARENLRRAITKL